VAIGGSQQKTHIFLKIGLDFDDKYCIIGAEEKRYE